MNFTFFDLGNSMVNMVQPNMSEKTMKATRQPQAKEPLFADKLSKILENGRPANNQNVSQIMDQPESEEAGEFIKFLQNKLENKKGTALLTELKNILLGMSNGDLSQLSVDENGIAVLKQLLTDAGFNQESMDRFFADLTAELDGKSINLDELFTQLFELPMETDTAAAEENQNYLDTSSLPFLESILTAFNLPADQVHQILQAADEGEKGINLDAVIDQLNEIQKKSFYTHTQYHVESGKENMPSLFQSLNLDPPADSTGQFTLNELVRSLERLRNQLNGPEQTARNGNDLKQTAQSEDLLKALFKGLEIKNRTGEKQGFEFSYDQVKNQFKDEFLANSKKGRPAGFLGKTMSEQEMSKAGLKEMEALLGEKMGDKSSVKEMLANAGTSGKNTRSKPSSLFETLTTQAMGEKSAEAQTQAPILKSKSNFKSLPTFVTNQVSKSIVRAVNQGENTLKIQLKPPELGRLTVTIDNSGNTMKVNIVTDNAAARDILVTNASELKSVLSNSGVNLERFDVDMNSDFRQSMADARGHAGNSNKRNQDKTKETMEPSIGETVTDAANLMEAIEQGQSLHFVA